MKVVPVSSISKTNIHNSFPKHKEEDGTKSQSDEPTNFREILRVELEKRKKEKLDASK